MKASELRIGNYVKYEGYECYREINEISKHFIKYHDSMLMPYCEAPDKPVLVGIPLTEEWLLKFGFEQLTPKYYVLNIDENISFAYYYTYSGGVWHFEFEGIPIKIEYINQLQNIYFALTGNELEIKE